MANLAPLVLDAVVRLSEGRSPLAELWQPFEPLATQIAALELVASGLDGDWPLAAAEEWGLEVAPQSLFELASELAGPWLGLTWVTYDEAGLILDLATTPREQAEGLVDGFVFWPLDDHRLAVLPSDSDPGRAAIDLLALEPRGPGHVRLHAQVVAHPALGAPPPPVRHCKLEIHLDRPNVLHVGMCVDNEDDPCQAGCSEVVRDIGGVPMAVDCRCPG
jgi:hypothetical protein